MPTAPYILVIDDEPLILTAIQQILTRDGYRIETAANVEDAFHTLRDADRVDVAIVDFMLHDSVDGLDVITQLRELDSRIGIVLMSGLPVESLQPAASKISNCQLLKKPFSRADVVAAVEAVRAPGE